MTDLVREFEIRIEELAHLVERLKMRTRGESLADDLSARAREAARERDRV